MPSAHCLELLQASLTTTMWVCCWYQVHTKPGLRMAENEHTHRWPHIYNLLFNQNTHTQAVDTCELRLVCKSIPAWRFLSTLKSPPAGQAVPPQHVSFGPGEGVLFALWRLFWFYSKYPIAAAKAELWACCCTLFLFFWSAGKPGNPLSLRNGVITLCAMTSLLQPLKRFPHQLPLTWTLTFKSWHL